MSAAPAPRPLARVARTWPSPRFRPEGLVRLRPARWGPYGALVAALATLLVAVADTAARLGSPLGTPLFWIGLLLLYGPVAARLMMPGCGRAEAFALVGALATCLFLTRVFFNPLSFAFHDEFAHWRAAQDVIASRRLFAANPLLPIASSYPGLASMTSAVAELTGLSVFQAGLVIVGIAHVGLCVGIFALADLLTGDQRVAGLAAVVYAANPGFLLFDAQYSYESVALPMLVLAIYLLALRARAAVVQGGETMLVLAVPIAAVVVTHHVTSYMLAALLWLWVLARWLVLPAGAAVPEAWRRFKPLPWAAALSVAAVGWVALVRAPTWSYLAPHLSSTAGQIAGWFAGHFALRTPFTPYAGSVAPSWERLASYGSIALLLVGLVLGLQQVWHRYLEHAPVVALALLGLGYPLSLIVRLTPAGAEAANRTSEFIFISLGLLVGVTVIHRAVPVVRSKPAGALAIVALMVIVLGSAVVGTPDWGRLPGPYLVSADQRSIEPQGITSASWVADEFGPGNRVIADRINSLLLATYGRAFPVTSYNSEVATFDVVMSPGLGRHQQQVLALSQSRFIVVDWRLTTGLPYAGVYFEVGEPLTNLHTSPLPAVDLAKFDGVRGLNRVYDSGDIVIYELAGGG